MIKDQVVNNAMEIIINAGDARLHVTEALTAIAQSNYELATEKLRQAQEKLSIAHKLQTDMIQGEAKGEVTEYSLLFAHAQDTLMTIQSEYVLAKQLFKVFEVIEQRLAKLEKEKKDN